MMKTKRFLVLPATSRSFPIENPIFLDYHSTTPLDPRVAGLIWDTMTGPLANASSTDHVLGRLAAKAVENARKEVASLVNAERARVVLTGGATEAINLVIQSCIGDFSERSGARIILSPLEHPAVLETCLAMGRTRAVKVDFIGTDDKGRLDLNHLQNLLEAPTNLVAVMAANNEIGNIYPFEKIATICQGAGARYLCDATQAAGKIEIDFEKSQISYLVMSAHKLYGPKGIGALVCKKNDAPKNILYGGSQEYGIRPGTLNVPAIVGFGEACRLRKLEMINDEIEIGKKRDVLLNLLQQDIPELLLNGDQENKLAGNLHISVPGVVNDAVIARVGEKVCISRGASCISGTEKPSHVLEAMHLPQSAIDGALRISLGKFTTDAEVTVAAKILTSAILDVLKALHREPQKI